MSWLPLAIVALFFVRGLFNFINEYCTTYLSSHLVQRLRGENVQQNDAPADFVFQQ